jgi:hypothetical protein
MSATGSQGKLAVPQRNDGGGARGGHWGLAIIQHGTIGVHYNPNTSSNHFFQAHRDSLGVYKLRFAHYDQLCK